MKHKIKFISSLFLSLFFLIPSASAANTNPSAEIFLQLGHADRVYSVSFSPDGRYIASGGEDETVKIWEAESGKLLRTLSGHDRGVSSVSFSPNGRYIASGGYDNTVKLWETESGKLLGTLSGHEHWVTSVSFSPDGRYIASGSWDKTVKLWEAESGKLLRTLSGHTDFVLSVSFSPNGRYIASGSWDKTIKIWEAESGKLQRTLSGHDNDVTSVSFSPNGRYIASGSYDNTVKIWEAESGKLLRTLSGHDYFVTSVSFSPNGRYIASGSRDNTVKLWEAESGKLRRTLSGHEHWVTSVSFSPDGRYIASGSRDDTVKLWEAESGKLRRTLSGHDSGVTSVSFSPNSRYIASGSGDRTVKLWEAESGKLRRTLSGHTNAGITSVSFSPNGRYIASGSDDNTVKLWEAESGKLRRTLSGHEYWVTSVSFSPNGRYIASGSWDNTVKLWEAESGKLRGTLSGHDIDVTSVSFSPDGRYIASGSWDNTVKLWEAESGKLLGTLSGHDYCVTSVSFSPDGKYIASGSYDNTVKLWDTHNGYQLITIAMLPGNEWFAWLHGRLFYNASLQGDEYAAVRFDNALSPVYPLTYYRKELKRTDLVNALSLPQPKIGPKPVRLWWDTTPNKGLWAGGISFILGTAMAFVILLRRRSDPLEIAKQFFTRAGFKKIEPLHSHLLLLQAEEGQMPGIVSIWQEGQDIKELSPAVAKYARETKRKVKLYLVYSGGRPSTKDIQAFRKEIKCEVIPLLSSRLEKALFAKDQKKVLKELEEPFLTRLDPYAESKPIHDPTWFYGRDELMKRLPAILLQGQHIGILGLRKVGKTSLIKQIQQRFIETPTVYIDCQAFSPKAEIYFEEILKQLRAELLAWKIRGLPPVTQLLDLEDIRKQFLAMFELWIKSGRQEPFLIILDEIDKFFPSRELKDSESILIEYVYFFRVLRGLAQSHQCLVTLVVAYRPDINRHNLISPAIGENPMFKSFQEEYLGFLNLRESVDMIQGIGSWKDIIWEEDAAQRVFEYCGGHPLVIRYFASLACACEQGTLKYIDYNQVENTAKEIRKTFHKNEIGNYYQEGVWNLLSEREKEVLSLIYKKDDQEILESQILAKAELKDALTNLENFGLVVNEEGKIHFTAILFNEWVKRRIGK